MLLVIVAHGAGRETVRERQYAPVEGGVDDKRGRRGIAWDETSSALDDRSLSASVRDQELNGARGEERYNSAQSCEQRARLK